MEESVPLMVVLSPVNVIILFSPSAVTAAGGKMEGFELSLVSLFPVTLKFSPLIFPPFSA